MGERMTMKERIARAIYDAPTFDGDAIGVHLYQSQMIEMSTNSAEECRDLCMEVCRDAAEAVLDAMREPDEPMIDAAWEATKSVDEETRMMTSLMTAKDAHGVKMRGRWQAMIDAALTEGAPE